MFSQDWFDWLRDRIGKKAANIEELIYGSKKGIEIDDEVKMLSKMFLTKKAHPIEVRMHLLYIGQVVMAKIARAARTEMRSVHCLLEGPKTRLRVSRNLDAMDVYQNPLHRADRRIWEGKSTFINEAGETAPMREDNLMLTYTGSPDETDSDDETDSGSDVSEDGRRLPGGLGGDVGLGGPVVWRVRVGDLMTLWVKRWHEDPNGFRKYNGKPARMREMRENSIVIQYLFQIDEVEILEVPWQYMDCVENFSHIEAPTAPGRWVPKYGGEHWPYERD